MRIEPKANALLDGWFRAAKDRILTNVREEQRTVYHELLETATVWDLLLAVKREIFQKMVMVF